MLGTARNSKEKGDESLNVSGVAIVSRRAVWGKNFNNDLHSHKLLYQNVILCLLLRDQDLLCLMEKNELYVRNDIL